MDTQSRLLLTRPRSRSEAFARRLENAFPGRFSFLISPLLEIRQVAVSIDLSGVQGLIFTSATAVRIAAMKGLPRDLPVICVGPATSAEARKQGFHPRDAGGDAADVSRLALQCFSPAEGKILHIRGRHTTGDLAGQLAAGGLPAEEVIVYDQRPADLLPEALADIRDGRIAFAAFFSPRSAGIFRGQAEMDWNLTATTAVCLSRNIAEELTNLPFKSVYFAERPNANALTDLLGKLSVRTGSEK